MEKRFDDYWGEAPIGSAKYKAREKAKQFFKEELKSYIRINDVSSWIEYGKKKGYNKFLIEKELKREREDIIDDIVELREFFKKNRCMGQHTCNKLEKLINKLK